MNVKGNERAELVGSFVDPSEGWHRVCIQEGIDVLKKDGEVIYSKFGGHLATLAFPVLVDEDGEEDGRRGTIMINYLDTTDKGRQRLADVIACCGMLAKFEEVFPGDVDIWSERVVNAVKTKLVGKFLDAYFAPNKDGRMRITVIQKLGMPREEPKTAKTKGVNEAKEVPTPNVKEAAGW